MRELKFTKMHGLGNDYIYFNCFSQEIENPEALAIKLSDRHFGIGGDGIVLICPSSIADAKMRMFNVDGSEGKMCGNAIRCVGKYLYENGIVAKTQMNIETLSGIKRLELRLENDLVKSVCVDMGSIELSVSKIPAIYSGTDSIINMPKVFGKKEYRITALSVGNPHCVIFTDDVLLTDVDGIGRLIESDAMFPERTNVEFVQIKSADRLRMRVFERGSGETMACGTGACAAVAAARLCGFCKKSGITVELSGGELYITYDNGRITMSGSADKVFDGVVEI